MYNDYKVSDDLKSMMNNERIVWSGRPKKSCFVLECIFNPMLIFAFIWFMFDFMFISQIFSSDLSELDSSVWMFVGFFALHLMPVWIYLGGVIFSFRKLKNTEYAITDKGIYSTNGCFSKQYNFKPFTDLSHVYIHRGIFDQWLGVGDVISECHHYAAVRSGSRHSDNFTISDIPDYVEVCNIIKSIRQIFMPIHNSQTITDRSLTTVTTQIIIRTTVRISETVITTQTIIRITPITKITIITIIKTKTKIITEITMQILKTSIPITAVIPALQVKTAIHTTVMK